jgi:hypothetical protein
MNPLQIEMAINAIVILIQVLTTQLAQAEGLTAEQKQAYLDRITAAQVAIPEWKEGG